MIGVHTSASLQPAVEEFFELFKTPWEYLFPERDYDVVLCCGVGPATYKTQLLLIYSGHADPDGAEGVCPSVLVHEGARIPIYTNQRLLNEDCTISLRIEEPGPAAGQGRATIVYAGYNLFFEIAFLLSCGQPANHAAMPALELHIALLRNLILRYTAYLIEIPCRPAGYSIIACLTHDVDHPSITKQRWQTILGFLYRATIGSALELSRRRRSVAQVLRNWRAALSLPLMYAGLVRDLWDCFGTYSDIEGSRPSTYFFIPTKGYSGRDKNEGSNTKRAAAYAASELHSLITSLGREGREIGVHGIDAWRDTKQGVHEREAIAELTGETRLGVRMHWLYYDSRSPVCLEEAGYEYDSSVGYNETVGYRAGTTQVFKPTGVSQLLELPLHIMDTSLFYPDYLNLTSKQALSVISEMVSQVEQFGGVITVNWHDRSLAPERQWGDVYQGIIQRLSDANAWFATCKEAVAWFRQRRSIRFDHIRMDADKALRVSIRSEQKPDRTPPLRLRVYAGRNLRFDSQHADASCLDFDVCKSSHDFTVRMHSRN